MNNHSLQNTEEEPIRTGSSAAAPAARGTFHRRPGPLYTEKHTVSCSSFPPNSSSMQHSCSHYTAICNQRIKNAWNYAHMNNHSLQHTEVEPIPHTRGTFHRRPEEPLYTEKHTVSCSGFPPNSSPMQHSCSHFMIFAIRPPFFEYTLTLLIGM